MTESLQYSTEALNVQHLFYRVDLIAYVEGEDDVVFWDRIFSQFTTRDIEFLPVGSSTTLDKYIENIISGSLNAVAARDSDYLTLTGKTCDHPRVIYTYGYSIENSLLTADSVYEICRVSTRGRHVQKSRCEEWLKEFSEGLKTLLILDLANEIESAGIEVLGNNCSLFMLNQHSDELVGEKVKGHIAKIEAHINEVSKNLAISAFQDNNDSILRWLRGHLLISGIQKFISNRLKELGRKDNISFELLFTNAIHQFYSSFNQNHPHFSHYETAIQSVEKSL
jgi:hypothetical protein